MLTVIIISSSHPEPGLQFARVLPTTENQKIRKSVWKIRKSRNIGKSENRFGNSENRSVGKSVWKIAMSRKSLLRKSLCWESHWTERITNTSSDWNTTICTNVIHSGTCALSWRIQIAQLVQFNIEIHTVVYGQHLFFWASRWPRIWPDTTSCSDRHTFGWTES